MYGDRVDYIQDPGPMRVSRGVRLGLLGLGAIGLIALLAGVFTGDAASRQEAWAGFFVSYLFFWLLGLGGAAFLAIQYVTGAKWFVVMKRLPEALTAFVYRGGFALPLVALLGTAYLYPWADSGNYAEIWGTPGPEYPYAETLKAFWLSVPVHWVRVVAYTAVLAGLSFMLVKASREESVGQNSLASKKRVKASILFLIPFGFVFSFFAWEMIMSVEPRWFSTMFGVYIFAGAFQAAMCLMMLGQFAIRRRTTYMRERQMYDMGTYIMAFSCFMAYIGFSQFMLIWYANIPDETFFYLDRYANGWWVVTVALPFLKFVLPFLILMPPPLRTNLWAQVFCCAAILLGQLLDIYWIVYPAYFESLHLPSLINILTFLGVFGVFGFSVLTALGERSMLPVEDAELLTSVNGDYLHA